MIGVEGKRSPEKRIELMNNDSDTGELKKQELQYSNAAGCEHPAKENQFVREILTFMKISTISFMVSMVIAEVVIMNAVIPSASMSPTLKVGDRIVVNRLDSKIKNLDIAVFYKDIKGDKVKDYYVKRVIGVPGDVIESKAGVMYINGVQIQEPYVVNKSNDSFRVEIPKGKYFVMGDNRTNSFDSRFWKDKFVDSEEIRGTAMFKYFPKFETLRS